MRKKMSDFEINVEKMVKEVDSWGILTLMTRMKDEFLHNLDKERSVLFRYHGGLSYSESPLQFLDSYREAFERKYDEEFGKIYKKLEDEATR